MAYSARVPPSGRQWRSRAVFLTGASVFFGAVAFFMALGYSICEYECGDEERSVYVTLVAFGVVLMAAVAAWWKASRT